MNAPPCYCWVNAIFAHAIYVSWRWDLFGQSFYCASSSQLCNCHVIVWQAGEQKSRLFSVKNGRRAMTRLNKNDRLHAIGMIQTGMLHRAVAMQFGVHINTIQALWRRFQQFGIVRDWRHAGCPHMTSRQSYPTGAPQQSLPNNKSESADHYWIACHQPQNCTESITWTGYPSSTSGQFC